MVAPMRNIVLGLLVALPVLSGCITVDLETKIAADGSCVRKIEVVTSRAIGMLPHKPFGVPKDKNWTVEEVVRDGKYHYTAIGNFKNPEEIEWRYSTISFSKERRLFSTIYSFRESFKARIEPEEIEAVMEEEQEREEIETVEDLWEEFKRTMEEIRERWRKSRGEQLARVRITSTVVMPGRIIQANTDQIKGNTATHQFTMADVEKGYEILVESKKMNVLPITVFILLIGCVLAGIFWLTRRLI